MPEPLGQIRYTLTVHFQDQGLLDNWWMVAPSRLLIRCAVRATGIKWYASEQSWQDYLESYFNSLGIKHRDPVGDIPEPNHDQPKKRGGKLGIDWQIEQRRQLEAPLTSTRWKVLRQTVFSRDNHTCQSCGSTGGSLHADHIEPRHKRPDLLWEMSNIQTLCKSCHAEKTIGESADWIRMNSQTSSLKSRRRSRKVNPALHSAALAEMGT